jgi:hypothetical protein
VTRFKITRESLSFVEQFFTSALLHCYGILCRGPPGGRDKGQSPFGPQPPYGGGLGGGGGGWNPGMLFLFGSSSVANPGDGAFFDPWIRDPGEFFLGSRILNPYF